MPRKFPWTLGTLAAALLVACSSPPPSTPPVAAPTAATQAAAQAYDYDLNVFHSVVAQHGMVVSEQALASQVGADILKAGGNAVDAAVAVGFALAVTIPYSGNTGGGGFMMVHNAKTGEDVALDFREMAPSHATRNMYLDDKGNVVDGKSLFTHFAVGVPGTVAGLTHALQRWGTMPLAKVMAPAIHYAENGYTVSTTLANVLEHTKKPMGQWESTRAIFWKNGAPLKQGDRLVQKDLAASLKLIARDGPDAFYRGPIAEKIAAEMARHGGLITKADLANYKVIERRPIRGTYRGYEVVTMPPPSSGGIHLVQILNMMAHWPLADWGHNSVQSVHHVAEAMKLAYADRSLYLGDTDFVKVPVKGLTSKAYAAELVKKIHDNTTLPASAVHPGNPMPYESDQTTHFSVMDRDGSMVAVTYTLNTNFGSGIVAAGTGILLNNEMDDFSAKPGVPNAYGLIGGDANAVQANKRPLSSMTPTFVLKDGKPWLVTGSPGGARIITTVLQIVSNAIDYGMDPAEATTELRFHQQWTPDELRVEQGFPVDTIRLLKERGENVVVKASMGRTQTIQVRDGKLLGFSDPRNPDGAAIGF
jgi:gamma-glutamyltranspeptidase/glutathione hydrolase